jgi:hypothetical protein
MKTIPLRLSLEVDGRLVFMLRILSVVQLLAWLLAGAGAILFPAPLRIVMMRVFVAPAMLAGIAAAVFVLCAIVPKSGDRR